MSAAQRRRLQAVERKHGHADWQRYLDTPINEWPEWALKAWVGNLTDEELTAMITEAEAIIADNMTNGMSS